MDKFLIRVQPGSAKRPEPAASTSPNRDIVEDKPKKKKKKTVQRQSTVKSWGLDWLEAEGDSGGITVYCKACRAFPPPPGAAGRKKFGSVQDPFTEGTKNIKKYSAERHQETTAHKTAYDAWKNRHIKKTAPIVEHIQKMDSEQEARVTKLFDIAYHIAKHELPFAYFPSLAGLEKRHGVDLGNTYINSKQAANFTSYLAAVIRRNLVSEIKSSRYISVLVDGSTDKSTRELEVMYIKYMMQDTGIPRMKFFGICDLEQANAAYIKKSIDTVFVTNDVLDYRERLIGFGADGAAVNFGRKEGVLKQLEAEMPWIVGTHCVAHRLELAAKDAYKDTYFTKEIDVILASYASFYRRLPKRVRELNEIADILEESVMRPTRVDGTRWVDHRKRAILALDRNYPIVVNHLTEIGSDQRSDVKAEDAAKARGMLKKLKSQKFLLHLALYEDILAGLSSLSLAFQSDDICLPEVKDKVQSVLSVLQDISKGESMGPKVQTMLDACTKGEYRGIQFEASEEERHTFTSQFVKRLVDLLIKCLEDRFESFVTDEVFTAATFLDPKNWPIDHDDFKSYGDREVFQLLKHFEGVLGPAGCDTDVALAEWSRLKKIVALHYSTPSSWRDFWPMIFRKRKEDFPNFFHLIEVLQVIPLATAKVERAFSLMGRVKTDWRVNLATSTLADLMMIVLEGPSEEEHSVADAVRCWYRGGQQNRRPDVQPYGKRNAQCQ
nr:zinc finger protein 862-like [Lytechinus pictus]